MKRKTIAGLIAMVVIAVAVMFVGCVEKETPVSTPPPTPPPTTPDYTPESTVTPTPVPPAQIPTSTPTITTSGILTHNETWTDEVHIVGDIHIPPGITLTIKPGTKILVKANYDDSGVGGEHIIDELTFKDLSATDEYTRTHIHISVSGRLIAVGTPEEKIIFTSDAEEPYNTDWDGITFESTSSGEMKYCVVEWTHTGPALHGTNDVNISQCEIRHTFWGGLHAFQCSPVFEYNMLDDIGHEAFDTHKASPVIRYNNISHARVAVVFNYYDLDTNKPLIFENNIIKNCSHLAQLQENSYAIIRNNKFYGSDDTGGPWIYKGFILDSQEHTQGIALADNVNVEIENNEFYDIEWPIIYENIGPNQGIGHTTGVPEPFEIGDNPIKIIISNNFFDEFSGKEFVDELEKWKNVDFIDNTFG